MKTWKRWQVMAEMRLGGRFTEPSVDRYLRPRRFWTRAGAERDARRRRAQAELERKPHVAYTVVEAPSGSGDNKR
ncbi:hypothetical protein [Nonomuraea endophytica]|uniref:Uncharacterized protein n=1 Tax=Nonomuraea endophytica TaxID=714136 RepID=A0A7W8EJ74_9ACTN|nr:hypothetical protein [Nonomuraea endophytica]MBB5081339.1 hypothetical protein [Nonomuraea endophytica]